MAGIKIRTTHTGSLPRPPEMLAALRARDNREFDEPSAFEATAHDAVAATVRKQREIGIDIVNDGEMSKITYATYIKERLTGFDGESGFLPSQELSDFPEFRAKMAQRPGVRALKLPACTGAITWKDRKAVLTDISNLRASAAGAEPDSVFMTAASPGVISMFLDNRHYPSDDAYLEALVAVMRDEYKAIADAGFILQLDCPDLAVGRHTRLAQLDLPEYCQKIGQHIDAINEAIKGIPPERVRLHLCWGNYEGPHHRDVPLKDIIATVFKANADGISFEGANPRHEHEWAIFRDIKLPGGKYLIPGVIDSTTNYIEHPDLVAQRLQRYAELVGPENVIGSTDCGLETFSGAGYVDGQIAWAKLRSLVEGAELASRLF
jgi:5-methyltetrahydropteroyltriglutamate--homocysteine methyltransferase